MSLLASISDPIREFFTLRTAERAITTYLPAQRVRVRAHAGAADRRLHAARRVTLAVPAAVLLREAVQQYLVAIEVARDPDANDEALAVRELPLPELAPDPARPRARPSDDERVRAALAARDPLYFDGLSHEDAELCRRALDRAAGMLRVRVEARTLASVRAARWGRMAAVGVVVAYAAVAVARADVLPQNLARDKPVHASSLKHNPPDGRELVDGAIGASFGVHTNVEDSPSVVIDLEGDYGLRTIKVHNRADGWYDDCLPLVVEVSRDGSAYEEVARRETHFDADPPWTIDAGGRKARYVRLRVARRGYLALSEVEVYGRKQ